MIRIFPGDSAANAQRDSSRVEQQPSNADEPTIAISKENIGKSSMHVVVYFLTS